MRRPRILAIVLAGGQGSRLDVLTRERAKPALPVAGIHRLVDVPLTNLQHSGLSDVIVSAQYHTSTLAKVIADGRPYDLDRTRGGLRIESPQEGRSIERSGFANGNADALLKLRPQIRDYAPDALLVLSADHVYRLDYRDVVQTHLDARAACTIVTTDLSKAEAVHHATVIADGPDAGARVTQWAYKPSTPQTSIVATEVFVYDPEILLDTLAELHLEYGPDAAAGDTGLGDFGEELLPRLIEKHTVVAHPLPGYWRDAGRPDSYLRLHRDLIAGRVDFFGDPHRPVLGLAPTGLPALVRPGAHLEDSFLSPGCEVAGTVVRSVIGPGVHIAPGAHVVDSVLFARVRVEEDAFIGTCIVDDDVRVERGARIGVESGTRLPRDADIGLVGRDSVIGTGLTLGANARLEPGTTA